MLQTQTKQIGDNRYDVTQLGATEGRRVLTRLLKKMGPVLGAAVGGTSLADALGELCENLDPDDVDYLCDVFAKVTTVAPPGQKARPTLTGVFEMHFAGNYLEMFQWLAFCLEVNFSRFFSGAASELASRAAPFKGRTSDSESSPASTGTSGES